MSYHPLPCTRLTRNSRSPSSVTNGTRRGHELADELSALFKQQSETLQTAIYVTMSREEAEQHDQRRTRHPRNIGTVCKVQTQMTIGKGKRPRDPYQLAKWISEPSTSETPEPEPAVLPIPLSELSAYMAAIGRQGGQVGGKRRLTTMTEETAPESGCEGC